MAYKIVNFLTNLEKRRKGPARPNFLQKVTELNTTKILSSAKEISKMFDHAGLNGGSKEVFLMDLLRPLLLPNMDICTGTIFDCDGQQSDQIDIIIYDKQVIPPVLLGDAEGAIPYESVLATIEVKSKLTHDNVKLSIKNAWSVKTLKFSAQNVRSIAGKILNQEQEVHSPICCVFSFESTLAIKNTIGEWNRLINVVTDFNETIVRDGIDVASVVTPISLICIAKSSTYECTDANNPTEYSSWRITKRQRDRADNILRFVTLLIDTCAEYAMERDSMLLEKYINSGNE